MSRFLPGRRGRLPAAALASLALASCGPAGPKLYPVAGRVLFEGEPVRGATVVFCQPGAESSGPWLPSGRTGPDGSFTLATYPHGPGAPAGEYTVLVAVLGRKSKADGDRENKLPERYVSSVDTPLKVTVGAEPTEMEPFRLTK